MTVPVSATVYLPPGCLCLPARPSRLCAVVASGVAVTIFDRRKRQGGMGHYSHPKRVAGKSTPVFAAPALIGLVRMFERLGSRRDDLETFVYGGADNPDMPGFDPGRSRLNIQFGLEILEKLDLGVAGADVGGRFARKLAFCTRTGQSLLARVNDVRAGDWYPGFPAGA